MPKRITGDPLADYPGFESILQERIQDWRENRLCLCGCGETTAISKSGPLRGLPNYLKKGHYNRLYKQAGVKLPAVDAAKKANKASVAAWSGKTVNTLMLAEEIKEYCRENNISISEFGRSVGVSPSWVCTVVRRDPHRTRVTKESMVLLMQAMGKPVHSSLLKGRVQRDCLWCGESFYSSQNRKTCSRKCRGLRNDYIRLGGRSPGELELESEYGI